MCRYVAVRPIWRCRLCVGGRHQDPIRISTQNFTLGWNFLSHKCTLIWCQGSVLSCKFATLILFSHRARYLPSLSQPQFRQKAAPPFKLISCRIGCRPIELFGKFGENFLRNATLLLLLCPEQSGSRWRGAIFWPAHQSRPD